MKFTLIIEVTRNGDLEASTEAIRAALYDELDGDLYVLAEDGNGNEFDAGYTFAVTNVSEGSLELKRH